MESKRIDRLEHTIIELKLRIQELEKKFLPHIEESKDNFIEKDKIRRKLEIQKRQDEKQQQENEETEQLSCIDNLFGINNLYD
jgi:regulator of replication initiation timing